MDMLDTASLALIWLIRAGVTFRVAHCIFKIITGEDEAQRYKRRIMHTIVFYIISESAFVLKTLIMAYFGH